jgi:hypothetical protein
MALPVEAFRLPRSRTESEDACHRALRSPGWQERATDTLETERLVFGGGDGGEIFIWLVIWLLERLPVLRRRIRRLNTVTVQAPAGPGASQAEILASFGDPHYPIGAIMVRVSLNELGAGETDVTIAWSGGGTHVPLAVGDLRRSIEIHAGSTTPYRPPT